MGWTLAELSLAETSEFTPLLANNLVSYIALDESCLDSGCTAPSESAVEIYWKQGSEKKPLVWRNRDGTAGSSLRVEHWSSEMRRESYRPAHRRPLVSYLPFHYHHAPRTLRRLASSAVSKRSLSSSDPKFPVSFLNVGSALMAHFLEDQSPRFSNRVVLSHDIESEAGFQYVEKVAAMEESFGFRSIWNIVPSFYSIDYKKLEKLRSRGHEIGVHGIWHNHKETFLSPKKLRRAFGRIETFLQRFEVVSYRSPSWYRTNDLFQLLSEYFSVDMSTLDCDLICPGGWGGVGFASPYRDPYGLMHIPCNIPFEAPNLFGFPSERLDEYWIPKVRFLKKIAGTLVVNTHPEPDYLGSPPVLRSYEKFLQMVHNQSWKSLLPRELVKA